MSPEKNNPGNNNPEKNNPKTHIAEKVTIISLINRVLVFFINRKALTLSFLILLIPFIMYGVQNSLGKTENRVEDWVPQKFEETKQYKEFKSVFGGDELLLITWEGCTVGCPELDQFKQKLLSPVKVRDGKEYVLFQRAITGTEIWNLLKSDDLKLTDEERTLRMLGYLIAKDNKTTALIAIISLDGRKFRQEAVWSVWDAADSVPNLGRDKIHVAGQTMDSVAIDEMAQKYMVEINIVAYLIGIGVSYLCFRNWRSTLIVFIFSFLNQQLCLALIFYRGIVFDSILMLAVNLSFVLSMSMGIHFTNYYREALATYPPKEAVYKALSTALVPTFISIITTVAGLLSFMSSQLVPIGKFGLHSSIVLLISMGILLVYLPLFYLIFPVRQWTKEGLAEAEKKRQEDEAARTDDSACDCLGHPIRDQKFSLAETIERMFYPMVARSPATVILIALIITVLCIWGTTQIKTSIGLHSMLREQTRPIQDYGWIEDNIGPLIPVEIMLQYPDSNDYELLNRFRNLQMLSDRIQSLMPETNMISLLNFIPDLPDKGSATKESAVRNRIARLMGEKKETLQASGYFVEKDGKQYWRLTVRSFASKRTDYGPMIKLIRKTIDETFASIDKEMDAQADRNTVTTPEKIIITGSIPVVYRAQSQLLTDLKISFVTAFGIIGLILIILFWSVRSGLLAVYPSLLPVVVVFGIVGWIGLHVEIGTMLTGSAALGIAVDNTIHFITWFRIGNRRGMNRHDAVRLAYRKCGVAMFQTSMVCSLGLVMYMVSPFIPTIYFSFFMFALLMTALLSDLTVLPAILITRAGNLFLKFDKPDSNEIAAQPEEA